MCIRDRVQAVTSLKTWANFLKCASTCFRIPGVTSTCRPVYSNLMRLQSWGKLGIAQLVRLPAGPQIVWGLNESAALRSGAMLPRDVRAIRECAFGHDILPLCAATISVSYTHLRAHETPE